MKRDGDQSRRMSRPLLIVDAPMKVRMQLGGFMKRNLRRDTIGFIFSNNGPLGTIGLHFVFDSWIKL